MEYSLALQTLVKLSQQELYKSEFSWLTNGTLIPSSSKLHAFSLFIDKDKLIRVGGRLDESSCTIEKIHPILLGISARSSLRQIIHSCVKCLKANPKPMKVKMGNLPQERTSISWPLQHTGVDFAGPFFTKTRESRGTKLIMQQILQRQIKNSLNYQSS